MIVTKVLVLIVLVIMLCIVSFLNKDTETFYADVPFSGSKNDTNVFKEINRLNKIKHKEDIAKNQVRNEKEAETKIKDISKQIDGKMEDLMQIRDLLQILPTCREIDLIPNNSGGTPVEGYTPEELTAKCNQHNTTKTGCVSVCNGDPECLLKCEATYKSECLTKGDGYCIYDTDELGADKCKRRPLNPKCATIKKLNGDRYEYGPYLVPNAFNSF